MCYVQFVKIFFNFFNLILFIFFLSAQIFVLILVIDPYAYHSLNTNFQSYYYINLANIFVIALIFTILSSNFSLILIKTSGSEYKKITIILIIGIGIVLSLLVFIIALVFNIYVGRYDIKSFLPTLLRITSVTMAIDLLIFLIRCCFIIKTLIFFGDNSDNSDEKKKTYYRLLVAVSMIFFGILIAFVLLMVELSDGLVRPKKLVIFDFFVYFFLIIAFLGITLLIKDEKIKKRQSTSNTK